MKKITLLLVSLLFAGAQMLQAQRTITGTVISAEDNQGIPGVSVMAKGTTTGTTTNVMGQYSLNVPSGATTLVFSFMGMTTQEIEIGSKTTIDVAMQGAAQSLEGVVVTALGVNRSEKSVGFATSNVGADELVQKSEPDALRALQGKIPGVDIGESSGAAGSSTRITIRGNSSFSVTGNNQPLFVVDGIPFSNSALETGNDQNNFGGGAFGNSFSTLDPNDVESMQILKGAAAAALYGSRAANGVILITTKSGSKTRRPSQKGTEVTLTTSWAWETISSLPDFQNTYGSGVNFRDGLHNDNSSWGARFDRVSTAPAWTLYLKAYPELFKDGMMPYVAQPDNVKDLFQTGFMQDYSFNVSSRNDKGVFNMTASRMNQEGYIPNSHFTRTSVSVGGNNTLDNKFKIGGNLSFSSTDQLGSTQGSNSVSNTATTSSLSRVFFLGRNWDINMPYQDKDGKPLIWVDAGTSFDNPLWEWQNNTHETKMNRIVAQGNIGYDIFSWLNVSYQLGYNLNNTRRTSIVNIGSRAWSGKGYIYGVDYREGEIESNLMATVTKMLTRDISLQAVIGQNINQRSYSYLYGDGNEFLVPGVFTIGNTANPGTGSYSSLRRLSAVYADIALGYKNYLFLNVTGRNDWSSTLPKENNNYFYPAITGSFVVTDAFPVIKNDYLSSLRLRAGWAKVGNDAGVYNDYEGVNVSFGLPFRGQTRMGIPTTSYDKNLMPEFTSEVELGGVLGLLKNRLNIDFTWYDRRSTGQIGSVTVPFSSGASSFVTNFGEIQNKGIELAVDGTPIKNKHIEWNLAWNFTKNKNTVISLTDGVERITWGLGVTGWPGQVLEPGMPYGYMYGTGFYRDEDGALLLNLDGLPRGNSGKSYQIGDPNPKFNTSILTSIKSHGFTLGVVFDYQKGGDVYSTFLSELIGRGITKFTEDREGGRIVPGYYADPTDPSKPLLDASGNRIENSTVITERAFWFGGTSSFALNPGVNEVSVFDATTFRLREISLGYAIPKQLLAKLPIGSCEISFSARNLWFYSPNIPKHLNVDPIMASIGSGSNMRGIQMNSAPSTRRFGINLKFTF